MKGIKEKQKKAFTELKDKISLSNTMQTPKVSKVVVSAGFGSSKDKKRKEMIEDRLMKITGQKPALKIAKKSISTFKLRQGDPVAFQVTLRGERMLGFLDKLMAIALPRTRDFRGISRKGVDDMGNMTLGIKEHTIFPETTDEELKDVFGMGIVIVTTAKDAKSAESYLEYLGFPFKKGEVIRRRNTSK